MAQKASLQSSNFAPLRIRTDAELVEDDQLDLAKSLGATVNCLNRFPSPGPICPHFKRACDFFVACTVLILLTPLLVIIAVAVKLESPGPIFFRQHRVGKGLITFRIVKFRTMYRDVPESILHVYDPELKEYRRQTLLEDKRITRVGKFLRKCSLDELPQLVNIVKGEMSFIGPRPLTIAESIAAPAAAICRYSVPAGLSGLAQIKNRSAADGPSRFDEDVNYLQKMSLLLDLKIFFVSFTKFYNNY